MNGAIWKFPLKITDFQQIATQPVIRFLHVGTDPSGTLCVWAIVDLDAEQQALYPFSIIGTGHPINTDEIRTYLGSATVGQFVWHVFLEGLKPIE